VRTYRIDRSYDWNYAHGPIYDGPFPEVPETPTKDFLGIAVKSRIGIAAGLLLNSRWIDVYSRLGFDLLTYKTVRSRYRKCYQLPNWVYLDPETPLEPSRPEQQLRARRGRPDDDHTVTSSVSFGMPSKEPEKWMADVDGARRHLRLGQALIVSVVASPETGSGVGAMVAEFSRLAAMAREAGAQVVEANLSCPNVTTPEAEIYQDAELSRQIAKAMREAVGDTPIALKAGYFQGREPLVAFLRAIDGLADAAVLVNGFSRRVVGSGNKPVFGPGREASGILGRGIHEPCVDLVRRAITTIRDDKLGLRLIAVGGVYAQEHAENYFDVGADAVMMGSAPMFEPTIAISFKQAHPEW
jgi:dihydroorotate dehydrogenase